MIKITSDVVLIHVSVQAGGVCSIRSQRSDRELAAGTNGVIFHRWLRDMPNIGSGERTVVAGPRVVR